MKIANLKSNKIKFTFKRSIKNYIIKLIKSLSCKNPVSYHHRFDFALEFLFHCRSEPIELLVSSF